jgi:hypothetical protein
MKLAQKFAHPEAATYRDHWLRMPERAINRCDVPRTWTGVGNTQPKAGVHGCSAKPTGDRSQ